MGDRSLLRHVRVDDDEQAGALRDETRHVGFSLTDQIWGQRNLALVCTAKWEKCTRSDTRQTEKVAHEFYTTKRTPEDMRR